MTTEHDRIEYLKYTRIWSNTHRHWSIPLRQRRILRKWSVCCAICPESLVSFCHLVGQCLRKKDNNNSIKLMRMLILDAKPTFDSANCGSRWKIAFFIIFSDVFQHNGHCFSRIEQKNLCLEIVHSQALGAEPPQLFTFQNAHQAFIVQSAIFPKKKYSLNGE